MFPHANGDGGSDWNAPLLSQSEIAKDEQNDDHGSDKPDDVVHDTLLKFDTRLINGATRRLRTNRRNVQQSRRFDTTKTCSVALVAAYECAPRDRAPGIDTAGHRPVRCNPPPEAYCKAE